MVEFGSPKTFINIRLGGVFLGIYQEQRKGRLREKLPQKEGEKFAKLGEEKRLTEKVRLPP